MECNFVVGQKVVAVGRKFGEPLRKNTVPKPVAIELGASFPKLGSVYTIRQINCWPDGVNILLYEVRNSHLIGLNGSTIEPGFPAFCFRPLVERKTDISIFKAMLNPSKEGVPA